MLDLARRKLSSRCLQPKARLNSLEGLALKTRIANKMPNVTESGVSPYTLKRARRMEVEAQGQKQSPSTTCRLLKYYQSSNNGKTLFVVRFVPRYLGNLCIQ